MAQIGYVALWWVVLLVLGLIAFPLVSRVCDRLPDKGYAISKAVGLLLVAYLAWIFASIRLIGFGHLNVLIALGVVAVIAYLLRRRDLSLRELPWRSILVSEGIFIVAFGVFLFFLSHKPDVLSQVPDLMWNYSEDFMDFGFLSSILRTDYFPPADPWLAGESIPYYYGGHLMSAVMVLISRVPPEIAYNLAVATFFSLAVCAAYGLGYGVTKKKLYGFVAVVFVCLAGFLSGAFQLSAYALDTSVAGYAPLDADGLSEWFRRFDFVTANRIIPNVVTHYPYYAFTVGDLHANVMDIPFQITFITLVFALYRRRHEAHAADRLYRLLSVSLLALTLGALAFVNTWSYPAYLALLVLACLVLTIDLSRKACVAVVALSVLLYLPYHIPRGAGGVLGIGFVDDRTDLVEFFEIFALFAFVMFSVLLALRRRKLFRNKTAGAAGIAVMTATALVAFLLDFQLLLILIPLIAVPLLYIYRSYPKQETEFILLLIATGALVVLIWEFAFIDDPYGPPNERYNTILKVYMSVWVLLGMASALAVFAVLGRIRGYVKAGWVIVLVLFTVAALVHPLATTTSWASGRYTLVEGGGLTLDGMAYLEDVKTGDYQAIRWMNENIEGSRVVLEAPGTVFEYSSRVSSFTGLPTLIGWWGWEVMWRGYGEVVDRPVRVANTIYGTTDAEEAGALLAEYNVEYIYVGALERERYALEGLQKFAGHPDRYEQVYENDEVTIYRVIAD